MNRHHAPPGHVGFAAPDRLPGALSAHAAATILAAVGDLTLILAADGAILDLAIANRELANYGLADWAGRAWADTVTVESQPKVAAMLAQAETDPRWRQVNHPTPNGEVPIRYLTMPLGTDGRLVAIGQDLRAAAAAQQRLLQTQQALERDYVRLRQTETRYRLLFDLGNEPVLVVDAVGRRIREANAAAERLFAAKPGGLLGQPVTNLAAPADRDAFIARLGAAAAGSGSADAEADGFTTDFKMIGAVSLTARRFRQGRDDLLLLRLGPAGAAAIGDPRLADVIEQMPDAFVLTDAAFRIVTANAAFADLVEVGTAERVRGTPLGEWLGRPGVDLDLIAAQLREHGAVRNVASILRGAAGGQEEIELSAVLAGEGDLRCCGFALRGVGRRLRAASDPVADVPRSVEQLTELVGRMSLKDIVRESTDLIERLCIEAALAYTGDNRANAAEVLGLSRQSLYSKLHRHGLGDLGGEQGGRVESL